MQKSNEELVNKVKKLTGGRDPLKDAKDRMSAMSKEELEKLVLIGANRIGALIKGREFDDTIDIVMHLCKGIDEIFTAYDTAMMNVQATTNEVGMA